MEDDGAQRHLLRMALNKRGHALVAEAARGDDPEIARAVCDVAIRSGVEVIRALQDRRVPVLVLSANAHSAAVTEALLAAPLATS